MCAETPDILTQPWWTEKLFGWQTVSLALSGEHTAHVIPDNDLRPHFVRTDCWCGPVEDAETPGRFMHNALDSREGYEEGRRRLH